MRKTVLVVLAAAGFVAAAVMVVLQRRGAGSPQPLEGIASEQPLDSMTRDELYDLAREQGIPGRSRMKKDELRAALRRA